MRTTETNLEPILLVHEGTDRLRDLIADAAASDAGGRLRGARRQRAPAVGGHRPAAASTAIAAELAGTQALIADGHHRYAAYLRLQAELRDPAAAGRPSPWDHGLALLVDQRDHPLQIGPIHRSVAALTMADLQELSADRGDEFRRLPDREAAFAAPTPDALAGRRASRRFVVSDGRAWAVLRTPRTSPVDAAVLHEVLLPAWGVAEEQIGYHHSLDQALHTTARQPGHRGRGAPAHRRRGDGDRRPRRPDAAQVDVLRAQAADGRRDARPARRLSAAPAAPGRVTGSPGSVGWPPASAARRALEHLDLEPGGRRPRRRGRTDDAAPRSPRPGRPPPSRRRCAGSARSRRCSPPSPTLCVDPAVIGGPRPRHRQPERA